MIRRHKQVMIMLAASLIFARSLAFAEALTDVDITDIEQAVAPINKKEITWISAVDIHCEHTIEVSCSKEVAIRFEPQSIPNWLYVSKVDSSWIVGAWQRSELAYSGCIRSLEKRWKNGELVGPKNTYRSYREELWACYDLRGIHRLEPPD